MQVQGCHYTPPHPTPPHHPTCCVAVHSVALRTGEEKKPKTLPRFSGRRQKQETKELKKLTTKNQAKHKSMKHLKSWSNHQGPEIQNCRAHLLSNLSHFRHLAEKKKVNHQGIPKILLENVNESSINAPPFFTKQNKD